MSGWFNLLILRSKQSDADSRLGTSSRLKLCTLQLKNKEGHVSLLLVKCKGDT